MTDFSFRAVQIIEDTLNAVQQADEIEGLDLGEYARVLYHIADILKDRADNAIDNLLEMTA
jgi:hypothetical protein